MWSNYKSFYKARFVLEGHCPASVTQTLLKQSQARLEGAHLDGVLAAGTGAPLDEGVAHVDDAADAVGVGVELSFKGLVLLVFALQGQTRHHQALPKGLLCCSHGLGCHQL